MQAAQSDLFGHPSAALPAAQQAMHRPSGEVVAAVRDRLHATLALVKGAETMPWGGDILAAIREDNAFRFGTTVLPAEEGAALWSEFDQEMDRLYAAMNEEAAASAS